MKALMFVFVLLGLLNMTNALTPFQLRFKISKAQLQPDGQSVELTIEDWQPAHMLELNMDLKTSSGQSIRTKINHTVHVIP